MKGLKWTAADDALLRKAFDMMTQDDLAKLFPRFTPNAVRQHAYLLGLRANREKRKALRQAKGPQTNGIPFTQALPPERWEDMRWFLKTINKIPIGKKANISRPLLHGIMAARERMPAI